MKVPLILTLVSSASEESFFSMNLVWSIINFIMFLFLLYFFSRKQVRDFFFSRKNELARGIEEGKKQKEEAEKIYTEAIEKKEKLDKDIKELVENTVKEAEKNAQKIIENAKEMAEKIKAESKKIVQGEVQKAKAELMTEVSEIVRKRSEEILREKVLPEDNKKLIEELLQNLEKEVSS